jgi:ActR/RegA family two-component response regulator
VTQTTSADLRVLICDDEYLLAIDMAQQFEALDAEVLGTFGKLADLRHALKDGGHAANAVVLDLRLNDGSALDVLPMLEEQGIAVAITSGFGPEERPAEWAHIPWIGKPANAEDIAAALCNVIDNQPTDRSAGHSV